MVHFADSFLKPYIRASGYLRLCEIGSSRGANTDRLLELADVTVDIVDPCLDEDLGAKYRGDPRLRIHRHLSLEALRELSEPFDVFLIDGDHNWYTVFHELKLIAERGLLRPGGTIFFHDVGWPYGRRDMYYQPDTVPAPFRQPFRRVDPVPGEPDLPDVPESDRSLCNAVREGGPRNGVLTAIEDFLRENRGRYRFFRVDDECGLGVLRKNGAGRSGTVFRRARWREALRRAGNRAREARHRTSLGVRAALRSRLPALYAGLKRLKGAWAGRPPAR